MQKKSKKTKQVKLNSISKQEDILLDELLKYNLRPVKQLDYQLFIFLTKKANNSLKERILKTFNGKIKFWLVNETAYYSEAEEGPLQTFRKSVDVFTKSFD